MVSMTELQKILCASFLSFALGYVGGRLQAWHNHRHDARRRRQDMLEAFLQAYLKRRTDSHDFGGDVCLRMAAFQELGAFYFTREEIEFVRNAVIARGFADPLVAYSDKLGWLEGYPHTVFGWAETNRVNLGNTRSVLASVIRHWESLVPEDEESERASQLLQWRVELELRNRGSL